MAHRGAIIFAGLFIGGVAAFAGESVFPDLGSPQPAGASERANGGSQRASAALEQAYAASDQSNGSQAPPPRDGAPQVEERADGLTYYYPTPGPRPVAATAAKYQPNPPHATSRHQSALTELAHAPAAAPLTSRSSSAADWGDTASAAVPSQRSSAPFTPSHVRIEKLIVGGELLATGLVSETVVREQERRSRYLVCFQLSSADGMHCGDFRLEDSGGVISEPLCEALRAGMAARVESGATGSLLPVRSPAWAGKPPVAPGAWAGKPPVAPGAWAGEPPVAPGAWAGKPPVAPGGGGLGGSTLRVVFPVYNDSSPARLLLRTSDGRFVPVSN